MKKLFVLLALVFLVSGCTTLEINDNLEKVIDEVLTDNTHLHNQNFAGYQYYLPREVSIIDKYDYNTILMYKKNKMYLYVDIISYYHKVKENYEKKDDLYFSQVINYDNKEGYINVKEIDDEYYIKIVYNYGKIEAYVGKQDLNGAVLNALSILKSLKYNDVVIDSLIGENKIEYQEDKFDLFESEGAIKDNYLDVNDNNYEYDDNDRDEELEDDDRIDIIEEDFIN